MHVRYDHLRGLADGPRLLFRSSHIYLLFSSLLNVLLGTYFVPGRTAWRRGLQCVGSALVAMGPFLFVIAFLREPWLYGRAALRAMGDLRKPRGSASSPFRTSQDSGLVAGPRPGAGFAPPSRHPSHQSGARHGPGRAERHDARSHGLVSSIGQGIGRHVPARTDSHRRRGHEKREDHPPRGHGEHARDHPGRSRTSVAPAGGDPDTRRSLLGALAGQRIRSFSGKPGEVPPVFVAAVDNAKAAPNAESDADLRPFWDGGSRSLRRSSARSRRRRKRSGANEQVSGGASSRRKGQARQGRRSTGPSREQVTTRRDEPVTTSVGRAACGRSWTVMAALTTEAPVIEVLQTRIAAQVPRVVLRRTIGCSLR